MPNVPNLGPGGPNLPNPGGNKGGVPGGPATPTQPVAVAAAQPYSPQKVLQTAWRPPSFVDFHQQMVISPSNASRALDQAIHTAYNNDSQLQAQLAATQFGSVVVTGSSLSISTGLASITQANGCISNGSTAHNFTLSVNLSQQPGCIDIYIWQPTSASVNTPIPCTSAVTVNWSARGSLT